MTSNGGLILVRELDERLGLEKLIEKHLSDSRQGMNKQFTLADLLRQSVYSRLAGYEDLNDAERLAVDPTFRLISSQRIWDRGAALTSTLHWFETELLTKEENLTGLMALNRETLGQAEPLDGSRRVVLDMDSSESPVGGRLIKHSRYYGLLLAEGPAPASVWGHAAADCGAADAIGLALPLRLQNLEPKEEGRHSVGEIDYAATSGGLQTGKERALGTPKSRWGCCGHKFFESRDEGELGYASLESKSEILVQDRSERQRGVVKCEGELRTRGIVRATLGRKAFQWTKVAEIGEKGPGTSRE